MIIAQVMCERKLIDVEVTNSYNFNGTAVAEVRALAGAPFVHWTHGGWCYTNYKLIAPELLRNIGITAVLPQAQVVRR